MSSATVRNAFRAELALAFPTLPQFATLGARVDNNTLPDLWAATDFIPISDNAIAIGSPTCHRELGTFRVYVVGRTGAGDAAIVAQADQIVAHFRNWRDAAAAIVVRGAIPPAPSEFSDGRWLICAVDFAFAHDHIAGVSPVPAPIVTVAAYGGLQVSDALGRFANAAIINNWDVSQPVGGAPLGVAVDLAAGTLTVAEAGVYTFSAALNLSGMANAVVYTMRASVNGVLTGTGMKLTGSNNVTNQTVSTRLLIALAAGTVLGMTAASVGNRIYNIVNGSLTLDRIG